MNFKLFIATGLILLTSSCASQLKKFTDNDVEKYKNIRVLTSETNLNSNCKYITAVSVASGESTVWVVSVRGTYENAINLLKEKAFQTDANTAIIDSTTQPRDHIITDVIEPTAYIINARLFSCLNY